MHGERMRVGVPAGARTALMAEAGVWSGSGGGGFIFGFEEWSRRPMRLPMRKPMRQSTR